MQFGSLNLKNKERVITFYKLVNLLFSPVNNPTKMPLNLWSSTAAIISIGNLSFTCIYTFGTISSLHNTCGEYRILFNPTMWFVVPLLFPQLYLLCSDCISLYLGLVNRQVRTKHMRLQKHSNFTNAPFIVSPRGHEIRLTIFLCAPP
jgi:hypothetical protein